jgi:hypothetical protein
VKRIVLATLLLASTVCFAQQTKPAPDAAPSREVLEERLEKLKAQQMVLIDTLEQLEEFKLKQISEEIRATAAAIQAAEPKPVK